MNEYEDHDALGLAELVRRGEVSPGELLDAAVARMEARDEKLGSVVCSWPDEARKTIESGLPDGPLRGVPFLMKDLHAHCAGQPTTNGSRAFEGFVPDHDAEITARYRRAGLVLFGKSASPEFGLTTTTESALHGATRNPWNTELTSGGSSGGASTAVSAGLIPAAHASDGGGSIRVPASCTGLFGLKPTRARTPAGPDAGEGWSGMSCMHAVTRSVRDSAALLDAVAGPDLGDPYWAPPPARPFLEEVGADPGRLRIAFQTETFNGVPTDPECERAARDAAALCESLGHDVVPTRLSVDAEALGKAVRPIIFGNVRAALEDRTRALGREPQEGDVEPITWAMIEATRQAGADEYARGIRTIHAVGRQVARFLSEFDALLTPTMAAPPQPIGVLSLSNPNVSEHVAALVRTVGFTQLFNASGHPAMSVPLHWSDAGAPIGVQFAGRFGDEATLLRLAGQLEAARPWFDRRPPE